MNPDLRTAIDLAASALERLIARKIQALAELGIYNEMARATVRIEQAALDGLRKEMEGIK